MKRAIVIVPVALGVVVGGLAVAPAFVDWNAYKGHVLVQAKAMSGLDVSIDGDISLSLLPTPRVYVEDILVKDPVPDRSAPLLALKMLDVRIALLPLLGGQVVVDTFNLKDPRIHIVKGADGALNYMTPEIKAMMENSSAGQNGSGNVSVAFKNVSLEGGAITYADVSVKAPVELTEINLAVHAGSLEGPFDANGALNYNGQPVKFSAKTGAFDSQAQSAQLKAQADILGMSVKYAGVVTGGAAPSAQGEISLAASSLSGFLGSAADKGALAGDFELSGVLTADQSRASFKDAKIKAGGQSVEGQVAVGFAPLSVVGAFEAGETVDIDKILQQSGGGKASDGAANSGFAAALPQTLELPVLGDVNLEIAMPAAVYNKQTLKDVRLMLGETAKGFSGALSVAEAPGGGAIKAEGALEFAQKAKSKTEGYETYSGPSAKFAVKGKAQNAPEMIYAFTGLSDLPIVKDSKTALFNVSGQVTQNALIISESVVNLDDKAFAVSGAMKAQKDSARPLLEVNVVADSLDFDALSNGNDAAKAGGDPFAPLRTLSLPYDLVLDGKVNSAVVQKQPISGLHAAVSILPNVLVIKDLSAKNYAGSSFGVGGKIGDLQNMGGLDIAATLDTPDPYKFAETLGVDHSAWPKNLGAVKGNVKLVGDINAVNAKADIAAFGGNIIFKGDVSQPMSAKPGLGNVALQVKHPNMMQLSRNAGVSLPEYKSFQGAIDLFANVEMSGAVTNLAGIKATLAGTSLQGNLKYDAGGAVPSLTGDLQFGRLVLQSAKGAVTRTGSTTEVRPTSSGGRWSSTPIDTKFLRSMNADLDVAAQEILYETWDMVSPKLKLRLQGGKFEVVNLDAGLFDGKISMQAAIDGSQDGKPLKVNASSKISSINMGALAKALSGNTQMQAEGDVSLNFDVAGSGLSQSDIVGSLAGTADLTGRNVVMKGFDLAGLATALMDSSKPLDRLQQVVGTSTSGGQTQFDTVDGAYTISSGVVNIDSMNMDGAAAGIVSKGNASLPRWYIDTVHTVTLKNAHEVAPFDVAIRGPLDNPTNTFGKGMFDTLLRDKLKGQVVEKLPALLGDKTTSKLQQLGILPQVKAPVVAPSAATEPEVAAEPAAGSVEAAPVTQQEAVAPVAPEPQPEPEPDLKQEAIKGLINGLLR